MPYSYMGTQGLVQGSTMSDAFFARLGATHLVRSVCGSAGGTGISVTIGNGPGFLPEDLVHNRHVILWGTNTISTNLHLWPFIREAKERGATVVVIDPAKTRTAAAADQHIRPMPGPTRLLRSG
jgi:anaerobic selenocysteine-containing dehydrogenase